MIASNIVRQALAASARPRLRLLISVSTVIFSRDRLLLVCPTVKVFFCLMRKQRSLLRISASIGINKVFLIFEERQVELLLSVPGCLNSARLEQEIDASHHGSAILSLSGEVLYSNWIYSPDPMPWIGEFARHNMTELLAGKTVPLGSISISLELYNSKPVLFLMETVNASCQTFSL